MEPWKTIVEIIYQRKDVTADIARYLESYTYMDAADGESDSIEIMLSDIGKQWMDDCMPQKADVINAKIIKSENGKVEPFNCGTFCLDDLSFSGRPLRCSIGAVSAPVSDAFKSTKRTKTWNKVSIRQIATEIAQAANVQLVYDVEKDITVAAIEQSDKNDCAFLAEICSSYGLSVKVYAEKIIIYADEEYERKPPVAVIDETMMQSWTYNTTIEGTYTGAEIKYTDPKKSKTYTVNVGGGERILTINEKADDTADAEKKAWAKLHNENKKMTNMSINLRIPLFITACSVITVTGLGELSGDYYVNRVKHTIANGYKMTLEARKILREAAQEDAGAKDQLYTVVKNDSLWKIAKQYYGSGAKHTVIYNANKQVIEEAAAARGKKSSQNGHWIWAGTQLIIPAI